MLIIGKNTMLVISLLLSWDLLNWMLSNSSYEGAVMDGAAI